MIFINMSKRVYNNRKIIFGNFLFAIIYGNFGSKYF